MVAIHVIRKTYTKKESVIAKNHDTPMDSLLLIDHRHH